MTTLPTSADFTTTPGSHLAMRTSLAQQRDYLAGLMGDDGLPATALASLGALAGQYVAKTAAYTVTTADRGKVINGTGTWTLSLPPAASAGVGFSLLVKNGGSGTITLDPSGAELVDGAATLALATGRAVLLSCTGTAWVVLEIPGKVTQTATDTTAGRLLKVGDFGLGSALAPALTDFTAELRGGFSRFLEASVIGYPTSLSFYGGAIVARGGGADAGATGGHLVLAARMGASVSNQKIRLGSRGTATGALTWAELYHSGSILGTVSQSAGVPTGPIFEAGSNANGRYERLADGKMECWQTMTASDAAATTWTFPSAFIEAPVVTGNAIATVLSVPCLDAAPTTTAATFSARDKTDARRADVVHLHAVGRWSTMT